LKQSKEKIGPDVGNECFLISQSRNLEDSTLDGKMIEEIPLDYRILYKNKIAIKDRNTNEIVLVVSFTKFKDIESSHKHKIFEKLTTLLANLRKGGFGFIKNKAKVSGKMFALGWRGGMDRGYTLGPYVMGQSLQSSERSINEWEEDQVQRVKWIANFYKSRFMALAPCLYRQTIDEAKQLGHLGVPLLGQTEYSNLE